MTTNTSWLKKYVPEYPELEEHVGASGYFSQPAMILDPQLFEGTELRFDVRSRILSLLFDYLSDRYSGAAEWTMAWLAGSGISYQWAADRGNGDLDVLLGIDYTKFVDANPAFSGMDRYDISYIFNDDLRNNLWPQTAMVTFNRGDERAYEITYYLNFDTEMYDDSIKDIRPYAAYNLTENHWTVEPESNPVRDIPEEYERQANANRMAAEELVRFYDMHRHTLTTEQPHSPRWHNAMTHMRVVAGEARALFDQIHTNRKQAFNAQGEGYHDFYNYQWQAAKRDGIVNKLNQIAQAADMEQEFADTQLYGAKIETDPRRLLNAAAYSQR
ncbi:hypothetical protein SEA_LUCKYSOCKE_186 [Streptomyces phage LuckySocke]|jgi:hypothetical protein|nr:hypothetical protein SEA_LUCKYSOCKE_186 [Streptomyces phage LuckySocke]